MACGLTLVSFSVGHLVGLSGAHVVKWPSDKHKDHNRSMYCVITVGGLSF